jgi:hypothetical protein
VASSILITFPVRQGSNMCSFFYNVQKYEIKIKHG